MLKYLNRLLSIVYLSTEKILVLVGNYRFFLFPLFFLSLILGHYTQQLRLYLDDAYFIRAALDGDYLVNFKTYLHYYGALRPLTIYYYYKLFRLYLDSPQNAHLIPLIIHIFTGILLFLFLVRNKISQGSAALISLIMIVFPFSVESWGWLAANSASLVIIILLCQWLVIVSRLANFYKIILVVLLQAIAVLIYESTILMSLSLAFYYISRNYENLGTFQKISKYFLLSLILSMPSIFYVLLLFLYPPIIETRYKLLNISNIYSNWTSLRGSFYSLFSSHSLNNFWFNETYNGLTVLFKENFTVVIFLLLLISSIYLLLQGRLFKQENIYIGKVIIFLLLSFILSLIPLSWQQNYLSFRLLFLPSILLIICITFFYSKILMLLPKNIFYLAFKSFIEMSIFAIIILSLFLQISILNNLRDQYISDDKIADEIYKELNYYLGPEFYDNQYILINNFPVNTIFKYYYGDYAISSFYHYWSGEYFLNIRGHGWKNYAVNVVRPEEFRSGIDKQEFFQGRPMFIFNYLGDDKCRESRCLKLENYLPQI